MGQTVSAELFQRHDFTCKMLLAMGYGDYQSDVYTKAGETYHPIVVGSSGGGLPRRPGLKRQGRFFLFCLYP